MQPITLKIKKNSDPSLSRKINVRAQEKNKLASSKPKKGLFFWLLIIITIFEAGLIYFLFYIKPGDPYRVLIPENSISVVYFKQSSLASLTQSINDPNSIWLPIKLGTQWFFDLVNKNGLDINQIKPLLEDNMALAFLPGNDKINPRWILLGSLKETNNFSRTLETATKNLKRNFNLTSELYRQIEIIQAMPLEQNSVSTYFAQPRKLIIFSNDLQTIKETIDRALE